MTPQIKDKRKRKARVILNCLPPSHLLIPSLTLNILKTTLNLNEFSAKITYWNLLFEPLFAAWSNCFTEEDFESARLYPFVYYLAKKYKDRDSLDNLQVLLTARANESTDEWIKKHSASFRTKIPETTCREIDKLVKSEIAKTDFSDVILSGYSAKFYQWLPALLVAQETKEAHPEVKTVIGGLCSKNAAFEMLKRFKCFDFASWGEGEYTLLDLCRAIKNGAPAFAEIPGLVYRDGDEILVTRNNNRKYLDLNSYPRQEYDDYYELQKGEWMNGHSVFYPLETTRGCSWSKCKFCVLSQGYRYRERSEDSIVDEINTAVSKYGSAVVQVMDNNMLGSDRTRLGNLLDKLKHYYTGSKEDYGLSGEMIPSGLDASYYKRLALAGLRSVQVGGESFADSLIKKMNKTNTFSDNLLAYKFCLKYGIRVDGANILTAIPGETHAEIKTCTENIQFVRFFVGENAIMFTESGFALEKPSRFFAEMSEDEKEKYNTNYIYDYLPEEITAGMNRFDLFHFNRMKTPKQQKLWDEFFKRLEQFQNACFTYKIYDTGTVIQYEEYYSQQKNRSLTFDQPEQWQILVNANSRLVSFDEMLSMLQSRYKNINPARLKKMMRELRSEYLLYYNESFDKIISVIDTDSLL